MAPARLLPELESQALPAQARAVRAAGAGAHPERRQRGARARGRQGPDGAAQVRDGSFRLSFGRGVCGEAQPVFELGGAGGAAEPGAGRSSWSVRAAGGASRRRCGLAGPPSPAVLLYLFRQLGFLDRAGRVQFRAAPRHLRNAFGHEDRGIVRTAGFDRSPRLSHSGAVPDCAPRTVALALEGRLGPAWMAARPTTSL